MQEFPFKIIHGWYKKYGRSHLPWREYFHLSKKELGYHVWLSEILLQQTQAERCIAFYNNILQHFPTVESLASSSYTEFFPLYKGLGYYSRARNMLKAAQMVTEKYDGVFPDDASKLTKIPGVGPYTAQAICAFAYNMPTLSFDTNLEKIFSRFYFGNRLQKLSREEKATLQQQFQKSGISAREMNAALMDFASLVDVNAVGKIDWENYPLQESKFYQTRGILEPLREKKQSSFPTKKALVIAILHEQHKVYFSSKNRKEFSPFFVGENTGNPRAMIQHYFVNNFGIEVSVRPPEVKSYKHETPYLVCYTQIQSGKNPFKRFEGIQIRGNEESLVEAMEEVE